jgi:unspecific monooxygenase
MPPGPRGRALVGNMYDFTRDPIGFVGRNLDRYGDVFAVSPETIVVNDPDLVREIYLRTNTDFTANSPILTSGKQLAPHDERVSAWMEARRVGWHGMNREVTVAHGRRMLDRLDATLRGTHGCEVQVVDLLRTYAGELAVDFCLGPGAAEVADATSRRAVIADRLARSILTFPAWLPLPTVRAMVKRTRHLDLSIARHVQKRRGERTEQPQDLLDVLLAPGAPDLTDSQIVKLVKANLLASYATPALAMSWVVHQIHHQPEAYARVRDEATALHRETGTVLDDGQLPETQRFVREVLRLYPPTWLMQRRAVVPSRLGSYDIRPGQFVTFCPYFLHRDPRWWDDPASFRPDRWTDTSVPRHRYAYVPFGAGPRVCLGAQLATYQLVVATALLAVSYRVEVTTPDVRPALRPSLTPFGMAGRFVPTGVEVARQPQPVTEAAR